MLFVLLRDLCDREASGTSWGPWSVALWSLCLSLQQISDFVSILAVGADCSPLGQDAFRARHFVLRNSSLDVHLQARFLLWCQ